MKRVQLLGTCLGDLVFPDVLADTAQLLTEVGYDVVFPHGQVCCGQPAFNAGHRGAGRRVAKTFVKAFSRDAPIVTPSGSCATMVLRHLPELVGVEPFEIWELSSFLDRERVPMSRRNEGIDVSYHDSCHMLRELGIGDAPRRLLEASGATVRPLPRPDLCCGFGGTFAMRQPEVSVSMADDKLTGSAPILVTSDPGCLMHLRGRAESLSPATTAPRVLHIATVLARGAAP
jgi:L-lactate dehydrogenase complex protein LldE